MPAFLTTILLHTLLGQSGPNMTAAERYYQSACDYLDGKPSPELQPVHIRGSITPGLPGSARTSRIPAEYRMERDWQQGERCGPVALFFLLRAENIRVTFDEVISTIQVTEKGTSMAQLQEAAAKFGLETDVIRFIPDEFEGVPAPFIVHWQGPGEQSGGKDHFDVVLRSDLQGGGVIVDTTNCAVTTLGSLQSIAARASGYALVVRRRGPSASTPLWALGGLVSINLGLFAYQFGFLRRRSPIAWQPA